MPPRRGAAVASVEALLRAATARLRPVAGDSARLEAEVLLAHVLGVGRAALLARDTLPSLARRRFARLVAERAESARPVAYLVGRRAFLDLDLLVDERVLVPRPETELLVERCWALDDAGLVPPGPVIDLGTGSGALALGLAARRPVMALDLSADALDVAAANRARLVAGTGPRDGARRAARTLLVRGDGLACLAAASAAAVVTNPPYIPPDAFGALPRDVAAHEPRMALTPRDGDVPGLYARIARQAARVLRPGGWLLAEVGAGQAPSVCTRFGAAGLVDVATCADLAGHARVVEGRRPRLA